MSSLGDDEESVLGKRPGKGALGTCREQQGSTECGSRCTQGTGGV